MIFSGPRIVTLFLVSLLLFVAPAAVPGHAELLYSIDPRDDLLRTIDPADASTQASVAISLAGETVEGGVGLATHPLTQQLWALLRIGTELRELTTIDPMTGVATSIGTTDVPGLAALAFDSAGGLYTVSGDGGMPPETLFSIDPADASTTFVMTLGAGSDGESLAFNEDDGRLYHASGIDGDCDVPATGDGVCFESIDPVTLAIVSIDVSGSPLTDEEVFGLAYWQEEGVLLWSQRSAPDYRLFRVTAGGDETFVGTFEPGHEPKGLAFVNMIPPPDAALSWSTKTDLEWNPVACALTYNVYRVSASRLTDADRDGLADDYGSCFRNGLGLPLTDDADVPVQGTLHHYLVAGENELGEASLGQTSVGSERPNGSACP